MWHLIVGLSRAVITEAQPATTPPLHTPSQPPPAHRALAKLSERERERGENGLVRVEESTAMLGCRNLYSSSQRGPVATSPSASPSSFTHMTEELSEQLGLGILVSRAIRCPPSPRPTAASTGSQHQLIIATVAVKEAHFGSDRLMTCKTRSY